MTGLEIAAILTGLGTFIAAAAAWYNARAANKAVNNAGANEPTLRDLVVRIDERLDNHIEWHLKRGGQ